jgi:hypothetical protein
MPVPYEVDLAGVGSHVRAGEHLVVEMEPTATRSRVRRSAGNPELAM